MSVASTTLRVLVPTTLLLAACGDPLGPGNTEPITELPRALSTVERAIIGDANVFGLTLMREVASRDDRPNIVLSPLSASMALGMTLNGTDGATFDAMRSALGFSELSREEINDGYRSLIDLLTGLDPDVRFGIANAIWSNEDITFHQAFFDAVSAAFDARATSADFQDPGTLREINRWVSDNTEGLIEKILDEIDPDLAMLLLNAIYFDGAWTTRFDPEDTRPADFTREDGSTVTVDMMNLTEGKLPMGGGDGYQAVELPYGGEAYAMVVLLPSGDQSARGLLARLDDAEWARALGSLEQREVDLVSLPRFTLAYDVYLNESLQAMGMDIAFRPGADFSRMSSDGPFCIDFVRQKTFIDVDERGTRAAAATVVGVRRISFNGIIVDRPFVFAIRERLSGTILFVGIVGDPTLEDSGDDRYTRTCG
jgi:serpin B